MSRSLLLLLLVVSLLFAPSLSQQQDAQYMDEENDLDEIDLNHHLLRTTSDASDILFLAQAEQPSNHSRPVYNETVVKRMSGRVSDQRSCCLTVTALTALVRCCSLS